jgi:predicted small metal-binding protein
VLGPIRVPPPALVLFTKQCGLIYGVLHWHKNLEDLYQLQEWITEVPPEARELLRPIQEHSRSLHGEAHAKFTRSQPDACHPKMPTQPEAELHRRLHEHMKLGAKPIVDSEGAWQGFPRLEGEEKLQLMRLLFAEEAMVLAATLHLQSARQTTHLPAQLKRAALRRLIQSALPEAWRYFGINNYREIAALIPETWAERITELEHLRQDASKTCDAPDALFVKDIIDDN